jgi:hypothetical protein
MGRRRPMKHFPAPRLFAVVVPAVGNLLAVAVWLPLLTVQRGAAIRPMRESCFQVLVAGFTWVVGVPLAAQLLEKGPRWLGGLCLVGSLTPYFAGMLTADVISQMKDLVWAP